MHYIPYDVCGPSAVDLADLVPGMRPQGHQGHVPGSALTMYSALNMQGKDKVHFAPHLDVGDVVVVKNAQHVVFTGKKWKQKLYRHHTG